MTERIYIDSCVYVAVFKGGDEGYPDRLEAARWTLESAQRDEFVAITSTLTIPEVFGTPLTGQHVRTHEREERVAKAKSYFSSSPEMLVELDEALATHAADLAVRHQLKGPDAVHVASALRAKCQRLYTWDGGLLKLKNIEGIDICEPGVGQQGALPGT